MHMCLYWCASVSERSCILINGLRCIKNWNGTGRTYKSVQQWQILANSSFILKIISLFHLEHSNVVHYEVEINILQRVVKKQIHYFSLFFEMRLDEVGKEQNLMAVYLQIIRQCLLFTAHQNRLIQFCIFFAFTKAFYCCLDF